MNDNLEYLIKSNIELSNLLPRIPNDILYKEAYNNLFGYRLKMTNVSILVGDHIDSFITDRNGVILNAYNSAIAYGEQAAYAALALLCNKDMDEMSDEEFVTILKSLKYCSSAEIIEAVISRTSSFRMSSDIIRLRIELRDICNYLEGLPQKYGTIVTYDTRSSDNIVRIYTLESILSVDTDRERMGLEPLSEYISSRKNYYMNLKVIS